MYLTPEIMAVTVQTEDVCTGLSAQTEKVNENELDGVLDDSGEYYGPNNG